jgi:hypothetical protein
LHYYWVQDPTNPNAGGNWQGPLDCASFLAAIDAQAMACQREETPQSPRPRIQFVVEMVVEVPWRTLILGRFDRPVSDETVAITLMERAVGNITCPPRCVMETAQLITIQPAGAGHCLVTLWVRYPRFKCSFIPGRVIAEVNHVRYFDMRPVVGSEEFRHSFVVGSGSQIDVWISPDNDQTGPYSLHVGPVMAVCP